MPRHKEERNHWSVCLRLVADWYCWFDAAAAWLGHVIQEPTEPGESWESLRATITQHHRSDFMPSGSLPPVSAVSWSFQIYISPAICGLTFLSSRPPFSWSSLNIKQIKKGSSETTDQLGLQDQLCFSHQMQSGIYQFVKSGDVVPPCDFKMHKNYFYIQTSSLF